MAEKTNLPPHLAQIVESLLARSEDRREIDHDEIGDAIGDRRIDADEIDRLFTALEAAGRKVRAPQGAKGVESLRTVLVAARALQAELGRRPSVDDIAARTALPAAAVRHALLLAKVMSRS